MWILLAVPLAALAAAPALEEAPPAYLFPTGASIPFVRWPAQAEFDRAYPANMRGEAGVRYECGWRSDGSLADCRATEVAPHNPAIEAAARTLLPKYRLDPGAVQAAGKVEAVVVSVFFRRPADEPKLVDNPECGAFCIATPKPPPPPPAQR